MINTSFHICFKIKVSLVCIFLFCICSNIKCSNLPKTIEIHGHRGCRGSMPENTIPGFIKALEMGVDVLELDIVTSGDSQLVVSHDPYMNADIMLSPNGKSFSKKEGKQYNLFQMNYDSIKLFDSGSKLNSSFPKQQKIKTYKPLLSEVIDTIEQYITLHHLPPVHYNIEIKSNPEYYNIYQPLPEKIVKALITVCIEKNVMDKVIIQSFDPDPLNYLQKEYPDISISILTASQGVKYNLDKLDFVPQVYSPSYKIVTKHMVNSLHKMGVKVVPWTVNEKDDMIKMLSYKVDGIISDYPEKVKELIDE